MTIQDGKLVVEERPDPEPGKGEVLVRVRAAGLNGADMLQLRGRLPGAARARRRTSRGWSWPARWWRSGPDAARFAVGDRVMAVVGGGGQAELAVVHERGGDAGARTALDWPAGRRPARRCSRPPTTRSSPRPALRPGERLLVHGGAGGVGTAAVQLGRARARA